MKYVEYQNLIYRGENTRYLTEVLIGGQWQPALGKSALDASIEGATMTEAQAREFQGDGWPADSGEPSAAE